MEGSIKMIKGIVHICELIYLRRFCQFSRGSRVFFVIAVWISQLLEYLSEVLITEIAG